MTSLVSSCVLEKIPVWRERLARELNLGAEPKPFVWPEANTCHPEVPVALIDAIADGSNLPAIAQTIDHTLLKPEAKPADIDALCQAALEHRFYSVCVNGNYVAQAAARLKGSPVKLAVVVGFPLGQMSTAAKAEETRLAVADGATEIDMVINVGRLKAGLHADVLHDIQAVTRAAGVPVKVIIETCLLDDDEKIAACLLSMWGGAAFVKTSTGFSKGGATVADVALMRAVVGRATGVKASGGVRTFPDAVAMLRAGANRIGTSSGAALIQGK